MLQQMTMNKGRAIGHSKIVASVNGGYVIRDAKSGRILTVEGSSGVSKLGPKSEKILKNTSSKRREALKRLADR